MPLTMHLKVARLIMTRTRAMWVQKSHVDWLLCESEQLWCRFQLDSGADVNTIWQKIFGRVQTNPANQPLDDCGIGLSW